MKKFNIDRLTAVNQRDMLCPIRYVYDYLAHGTQWLQPQRIALSSLFSDTTEKDSMLIQPRSERNGITLYPEATNLPVYTGLGKLRQSKHWKANERATRELLERFMQDQRCEKAMLESGQSMASLAASQLESELLDSYSRFSVYMFPNADEKRIQLLAQGVILIFIFDGQLAVDVTGIGIY